jgi:hypothetical protein
MLLALLILLPITGIAIWAFLRFGPAHAERMPLRRFNLAAVSAGLLLAIAWCVRTYLVMSPTVDAGWWPVIAALGALALFSLVLAVAALARNFIVFRSREGQPSQ